MVASVGIRRRRVALVTKMRVRQQRFGAIAHVPAVAVARSRS